MNPFLHSTVATPLPTRPPGSWRFPFTRTAGRQLSLGAGVVAVVTGIGMGAPAQAVDVNHANADQLQTLRGLGPRMAQTIVDERDRAGLFESLEDLSDRVRGIGRKRLQSLRAAGLRIGSQQDAAPGPSAPRASDARRIARAGLPGSGQRAHPLLTAVPATP